MRILLWKDAGLAGTSAVMPGWALIGAVKAAVDGTTADGATVDALPAGGSGLFTLCGEHAMTAVRALEGVLAECDAFFAAPPPWRSPSSIAAVQRLALVSAKRGALIELVFTAGSVLVPEGGTGDGARAVDSVGTSFTGGELTVVLACML
ncbi:hypothetical protein ACFW6E_00395 [Streptomyces olivaceoviridis]|uniref:hypothetical protein n=1 Tax=Streptomyces olivaceoviridis TaxID=1921 RepID=UPI0036C37EA5